jgi:hypothetical protein
VTGVAVVFAPPIEDASSVTFDGGFSTPSLTRKKSSVQLSLLLARGPSLRLRSGDRKGRQSTRLASHRFSPARAPTNVAQTLRPRPTGPILCHARR